ncbi:MAG: serine/threonine-protein kinase [Hallerella porci]|uniref:non-specific serine/threonine protein kinase n=1 Tax=Hallerella porci TaxID=1945871 RepID=A0ABX5LQH4_9BACT|nr:MULTISPECIES: serine/threonine-protein kinase [Hallerella]MCI5600529.1 serine/threonine protein kinase [Hallerella sp.]MDY3922134.1 serine/threonine-protein kinase [Hallerella porci]PWL03291.1 serine/threonine protein kinase [Hallerella porci]
MTAEKFPRPFNENYELLGVLGKGGMGYVYKALQKNLKREVALKVLDASSDKESIERFYMEAQAMKELDHQNLVQVFDFGRQGNQLFISMTYVRGSTLSELLEHRRRLDFDAIEIITKQVARGLLYAHSKGIVHRDVKPSNIMITHDNRVYLMDFGISHIQSAERLTLTGMTMGTPEYMSPEQCHGDEVTIGSDIYSLGVILFEMTCGRLPFTGSKPIEIAMKHVQEEPPNPENFRPDMPKGLAKLILKCLKKNVSDRFKNMQEFLDALDIVFAPLHPGEQHHGHDTMSIRKLIKNRPLISNKVTDNVRKFTNKHVLLFAIALFPLLILLILAFLLTYKPPKTLQEVSSVDIRAAYEEKNVEGDGDYEPSNLFDKNLRSAWLLPLQENSRSPIFILDFSSPTIITQIGFASGFQKSVDDEFGDRFLVFNKPKTLSLLTREGFRQTIQLEDIKGVQYPQIKAMETTEIQVFLDEAYVTDPSKDLAISEIRILGLLAQ